MPAHTTLASSRPRFSRSSVLRFSQLHSFTFGRALPPSGALSMSYPVCPRPLRPLASNSPPRDRQTSTVLVKSTEQVGGAEEASEGPGKATERVVEPQPTVAPAPSSLNSLPPPPHPPARRTVSAPSPYLPYSHTHTHTSPSYALNWDSEAFDELREILSASSSSPVPTSPSPSSRTPVLLPSPSAAGGGYPLPPRTPSRSAHSVGVGGGRTSRNGGGGHARRRSSVSTVGSGSGGSGENKEGGVGGRRGEGGGLVGGLVAGMGSLRVKTPSRVVGWDGEYCASPVLLSLFLERLLTFFSSFPPFVFLRFSFLFSTSYAAYFFLPPPSHPRHPHPSTH